MHVSRRKRPVKQQMDQRQAHDCLGEQRTRTYFDSSHEDYTARPDSDILLYQTEDGQTRVEVRLQDETVWLSQKLMADLFQKDVRMINEHIKNIFSDGEQASEATIRKFQIVQIEVKREVARSVDF